MRWRPCNRNSFVFDLQLFAGDDKTEEPTQKKRDDARKKGQVGRSTDMSAAFVLLMGFIQHLPVSGNIRFYCFGIDRFICI